MMSLPNNHTHAKEDPTMKIRTIAARALLSLSLATGLVGAVATAAPAVSHANPVVDLGVMRLSSVSGHERIRVSNFTFGGPSASFRIAVLAGADSYSIYSGPIAGGTTRDFTLHALDCGQPVAI